MIFGWSKCKPCIKDLFTALRQSISGIQIHLQRFSPPICMYFLCREKQVKILSPISHQSITPTQELLSTLHKLRLLQLCELYQQLSTYRPVESDNDWYCAPGDPKASHSTAEAPGILPGQPGGKYSSILIGTKDKKANIAFIYWSEATVCKDLWASTVICWAFKIFMHVCSRPFVYQYYIYLLISHGLDLERIYSQII